MLRCQRLHRKVLLAAAVPVAVIPSARALDWLALDYELTVAAADSRGTLSTLTFAADLRYVGATVAISQGGLGLPGFSKTNPLTPMRPIKSAGAFARLPATRWWRLMPVVAVETVTIWDGSNDSGRELDWNASAMWLLSGRVGVGAGCEPRKLQRYGASLFLGVGCAHTINLMVGWVEDLRSSAASATEAGTLFEITFSKWKQLDSRLSLTVGGVVGDRDLRIWFAALRMRILALKESVRTGYHCEELH